VSPERTRIPSAEARPEPTMIATGVASPIAQGQATSKSAMPLRTAFPKSPAISHQQKKVTSAATRTTGTKTELTLSATRWSGGLSLCASSTSR
jgi:hypothetical protein